MTYYTKNGSIPTQNPDSTEGWVEAPAPPADVPEGKELTWLNWEWVIRDPKPADRDGYQWNWAHETRTWVEYALPVFIEPVLDTIPVITPEPTPESTPEPTLSVVPDPYPFSTLTTDQMA